MVPATINEMLMQSYEGVIRLFPCWDKKSDASFENLRADGAFLVSAENKGGKLIALKIKSLKGRVCNVDCPDVKRIVRESDGAEISFARAGDTVTFETTADESYVLI